MMNNYKIYFIENGDTVFHCTTKAIDREEAIANCEFIPLYFGITYDNIVVSN